LPGPSEEDWDLLRRQWFGSVYEIADIELQRRTWLAPPTPSPHWSYVEFCCCFPTTDQLKDAVEKGKLNEAEFNLLMALGRAITEHEPARGNHYDHPAILADPAWQAVVATAEKTRQELLQIVSDPSERSYLIGAQAT
jgi:hypothetical protein